METRNREEGLAQGRPNRDNIFVKNSHDIVDTVRESDALYLPLESVFDLAKKAEAQMMR